MTGPRRGDVPWRTAPAERPFPDVGPDGTAAVGGADALRAPEVPTDATAASLWDDPVVSAARSGSRSGSGSGSGSASPSRPEADSARSAHGDALADANPLPALPPLVAGDDPASRAAVERWMDDDRTAHDEGPAPQPYRVLPPPRPAPVDRSPARRSPVHDDRAQEQDVEYEDPQVRAWRVEREFEAQFGQWRAGTGASTPMRRSTLVSPPVLLLVFVLLVVLYYALTT